jgi:hypothetical protein
VRRSRTRTAVRLLFVLAVVAALAGCSAGRPAPTGRCAVLARDYGLTPCPADPVPVEKVPVKNLDPALPAAEADRIAQAYLRSRALYYLAIKANSTRLFDAGVLHLPAETPLMFDAETSHIRDAKARRGRLVLAARARLTGLTIVPLPDGVRGSLGTSTRPMADAVVVRATGPESQVIRVAGHADLPVSTLAAGDSYTLLVGGVLHTRPGLPETFAELGQWECLDPDTQGACQLNGAS